MALFKTERKFSENPLLDPNHRATQIHLFGMLSMINYSSVEDMNNIEMFRFNIKHACFHRYKHTADPILIRKLSTETKLLRRPTPVERMSVFSIQILRIHKHIGDD